MPKQFNDWLQILGCLGVIGGLIFVGLQLSLDRQVALVDGTSTGIALRQQWAELANANADIWVKGLAGEALTASEAVIFENLASSREQNFFNSYSRAVRGVSSSDPDRFVAEIARELYDNPGYRRWWDEKVVLVEERRYSTGEPIYGYDEAVTAELKRLDDMASRR